MTEDDLQKIEGELAAWRRLPGRGDAYAQHIIQGLLAEVRRLNGIVEELSPAPGEVVRLHQLLMDYGRHNEGCSAAFGDHYRCRCGWREVAPEFTVRHAEEDAEEEGLSRREVRPGLYEIDRPETPPQGDG